MKKKILAAIIVIAGIIVIVPAAIVGVLYSIGSVVYRNNAGEITVSSQDEFKEALRRNESTYLDSIDITDSVTYSVTLDNESFYDYARNILSGNNPAVSIRVDLVDYEVLSKILLNYNSEQSEPEDAHIEINNEQGIYEAVPQVEGGQIDVDRVIEDLQSGKHSIEEIELKNYEIKPSVTEDDIKEIVTEANKYLNWSISYDSGQSFKASLTDVKIEDNSLEISTDFLSEIIKQLEDYYDNIGGEMEFTNINGNIIKVSGGTWGTLMNSAEELQEITKLFESTTSQGNRRPIMKQDYTEIGDTYIEISISDQHMWFIKQGEVVSDTSIVTGDVNKKRGTPSGVYFISEKIPGKYLKGEGYTTWVNRWMRLTNSGIGLHDASWRGKFGGSIYKGNGSHGCVNLPKSFAYDLYEQVYVGMPVIIY